MQRQGSKCSTNVPLAVCEFNKEGKQPAALTFGRICVTLAFLELLNPTLKTRLVQPEHNLISNLTSADHRTDFTTKQRVVKELWLHYPTQTSVCNMVLGA